MDNSDSAIGDPAAQLTDEAGVALDCAQPQNGPFPHNTTVADEAWTADESPHQIEFDTVINGTVTIAPCATVTIATGRTLTLGPKGKIIARGSARQPISFNTLGRGAYTGIRGTGAASLDLAYVTFHGGGDPGTRSADLAGTIELAGDESKAAQPLLAVDHVLVEGSKSNGIVLTNSAGFATTSTALTVTGAAQFPVSIGPRAAGTVPPGIYTGNGTDRIALAATGGNEGILEDTTLHALGVPYRVGTASTAGTLVVGGGASLATLRIEAGVTLEIKKGGVVSIDATPGAPGATGATGATGALVAVGTASSPIVFTSAEATPAAGDWLGIWFGKTPAPTSRIHHAEVRFAGGTSTTDGEACNTPPVGKKNDAAIRIFGLPATQFVTNTMIVSSDANGVDRGWSNDIGDAGADAAATSPSFLPTNAFSAITRCTETYPQQADAGCPAIVPCPMP